VIRPSAFFGSDFCRTSELHEFSSGLFTGVSYLEEGRPAFNRLTMLVDHERGNVLHVEFDKGPAPAAESPIRGLVKALLHAAVRPGQLLIANPRLQPILQPWCDAVQIELLTLRHLPALEAASQSLSEHLRHRRRSPPSSPLRFCLNWWINESSVTREPTTRITSSSPRTKQAGRVSSNSSIAPATYPESDSLTTAACCAKSGRPAPGSWRMDAFSQFTPAVAKAQPTLPVRPACVSAHRHRN
jgi:hypothetical protein